jgi:diketogulonate reductase-like aldo/keto reductase
MYEATAEKAVLDALEIGYRLIDTASLYNNETEVGAAINKSSVPRNEIFVTTKVGDADHGFDETLRAFDTSLQKLQMDYVDLYLVHWPIKGKRKDTWLALEKLYADKRVKAIGVANYLIPFLDELTNFASMVAMLDQVEFTPWLYQEELMKYCQRKNIQLQSYSPLTRGKKFNDSRLLQLCNKYNKTPAQIILQWNIAHGISTIPKSSSKLRLQENFDSLAFNLSAEDVSTMDSFNENFRICDDPAEMF